MFTLYLIILKVAFNNAYDENKIGLLVSISSYKIGLYILNSVGNIMNVTWEAYMTI